MCLWASGTKLRFGRGFRSDSNAVPDSSRNEWLQRGLYGSTPPRSNSASITSKEDLGRHHRKISPGNDRSSRDDQVFGHANTTHNAKYRLARRSRRSCVSSVSAVEEWRRDDVCGVGSWPSIPGLSSLALIGRDRWPAISGRCLRGASRRAYDCRDSPHGLRRLPVPACQRPSS
jgi:hypothetical protein